MEKFDGTKVYAFICKGDHLVVFASCIDADIHYRILGDSFMMFGRVPLHSYSSFVSFKRSMRKKVFLFKSECNE